jgi:hypothetical protein
VRDNPSSFFQVYRKPETRLCISSFTWDEDASGKNCSVLPLSSLPEFREEEDEGTDEYCPHDDD